MRSFIFAFAFVASAVVGCQTEPTADPYDPFVPDTTDDGTEHINNDGTEHISGYEPEVCDPAEVDVYDPNQVISYELDIDEQTLEMLDAVGYSWAWGETYDQLSYYAESITVDAPGCQTIVFEQPRVEMGRQMGYQSPYTEGSWIVEYNQVNNDQVLGEYDDARYWAPTYDGPVAEMWMYNWSMDYIDHMPHRDMAWMRMRTTWWGNQEAIYNSLEPVKDDFAKRNGMVALWEGTDLWQYPGNGGDCEYGDCSAIGDRVEECAGMLGGVGDMNNLIPETGACYDWDEISAVLAWQDWFSHWDGCGSNNCYQYYSGDADNPYSWKQGLVISGVDLLLNELYTSAEDTNFAWTGGSFGWACKSDKSPGGCREMYVNYLLALSELARSGQMQMDLYEVHNLRVFLDIALDGDEDWLDQAVDWVSTRPDYVDIGIETLDTACDYWGDTGYVPCDTGLWDTGLYGDSGDDSGRIDSGTDSGSLDSGR
ncbi:MAG: hypothetical protein ABIA83_01340 [Patescibacteria group bacterium]